MSAYLSALPGIMSKKSPPKGNPAQVRSLKPKGGRPTAERAKLRAAYLRSVAAEVFIEFGFERATVDEIAKRAGTSKETIYSKYGNKEDLFTAAINNHMENFLKPFSFLQTDEPRSLKETLRELGFQAISAILVDESQHVTHTIYAESFRFPELGKQLWEMGHLRTYRDLSQYFVKEIARGHLRDVDPLLMARQFMELVAADVVFKMMLNVQRSMTATQKRIQVDAAVDVFLRAYGT